ncbi:MAG TPA: DUF983 domain-containing protein [Gemmatimonadales bacterium]|nr:DUF983 domain-containing protein [Gemmatimonadales bacterium]
MPLRRALRLLLRAVRLRCPDCGGGPVFDSWFRMRVHCPSCGLQLARHERGYQVGSYMFNIIAAELIWAAVMIGWAAAAWPTPPWTALQYVGGALMILLPAAFYPFSKTLFLAFDLVFRPAGAEDPPVAHPLSGGPGSPRAAP